MNDDLISIADWLSQTTSKVADFKQVAKWAQVTRKQFKVWADSRDKNKVFIAIQERKAVGGSLLKAQWTKGRRYVEK